jgi:hypothetical protein
MSDYIFRKFLSSRGTDAISVEITSPALPWEDVPALEISFVMGGRQQYRYEDYISSSSNHDSFYEAVQFFQTLRKVGEEAVDELTARWLILKESELDAKTKDNSEKWEEDSVEESDSVDGGRTTDPLQKEFETDKRAVKEISIHDTEWTTRT